MASIRPEDLTPFGRLALKLDHEFSELARFGDQIVRVDIDSDDGLDQGVRILKRVALCSESLAQAMLDFSQSLQEARDKAEAGTKLVAERAQLIAQRRQRQDELEQKLERLMEDIKTAGAGLGGSQRDKRQIAAELGRLQAPMTRFIEAAQAIKTEAASSNFKRLERQADSMIGSLQDSLRKISGALASDSDKEA